MSQDPGSLMGNPAIPQFGVYQWCYFGMMHERSTGRLLCRAAFIPYLTLKGLEMVLGVLMAHSSGQI